MEAPKSKRGLGTGAGRKAGVPNRCNAAIKFAFAAFMEMNLPKAQQLWEQVAADDPKGALQLLLDISERLLPKLARTEVTGEDGGPVEYVIRDLAKEANGK